ncbi:MAG: AAA family ATPase, partial [Deltaproteobacteria bacterium]|nr:AAA family ATPase [Deltaproteobacteria bacterium]
MTASTTGSEPAAFAGRAAELSILRAAAAAAKEGQFSAVLISGEAGIGKSRLAEETCNYAQEVGFEIAAGRCFDTQSRLSYFPFIQLLRHLMDRASPPVLPERRRGTTKAAENAAAIIARLAFRAPRSARLNPEVNSAEQTELFESVICFLRARSETCPLLLLLEDLDWADAGSLSLLVHLLRMLAAVRLLIIGTCLGNGAPERLELVRAIVEWGRHRGCQRIRLTGLPEAEAASLVEQLLGPDDLPGETKRLAADIGRLTNGNPLFIHQIVRHLIETGRLSKRSGRWVALSGWESKLAAEDGMREVVDARLSRLSDRCRLVLRHAAVLGEEFELEVLARMLPFASRDLADLLEEASAAGIVIEARTDETADYAFAHGLIRQSLYERQSRPAKRALHVGAAHAIEAVHQAGLDSHLPQLALHYTKAVLAG